MEAWTDLALVAHELGSALTPTRNSLQLLQARDAGDPEAERLFGIAARGLERADRILENVATLAGIDERPLQPEMTPLRDFLQELADDYSPEAAARVVRLHVRVESDAHEIPVERFALERVISNLLSNALKFAPTHGNAGIVASKARGPVLPGRMMLLAGGFGFRPAFVQIKVNDDGQGIDPETRRHLFQPFFRGDKAQENPGMGLGLTVAQRLARRMRGDLRVDTPARGASLVLTLPADTRTFALVERIDEVREELQELLADRALSVAVLRRRSGPELPAERLDLALHEDARETPVHVAALSDMLSVVWSRCGVRELLRLLSAAVRCELGPQADRDFEVAVRRASPGTLSDPLLLQTAVRCHHSLAALARRREVARVENPRRRR